MERTLKILRSSRAPLRIYMLHPDDTLRSTTEFDPYDVVKRFHDESSLQSSLDDLWDFFTAAMTSNQDTRFSGSLGRSNLIQLYEAHRDLVIASYVIMHEKYPNLKSLPRYTDDFTEDDENDEDED